jgi:cytochrome c-type biogenesis protein CcmE
MDPALKRKARLFVALSAAVLLAVALIYTSFNASSEAKQPSDVLHAPPDQSYQLTGVVVPGSIHRHASAPDFRIADRDDSKVSMPVRYRGQVPDPFANGREVIVSGRVDDGTFVGERDSLITKCPSKYAAQAEQDPQHVIISQ